tara:strand:+ start:172 stop:1590 length:1419 start_codon:yes stop_codon:yes gene_type:complete
VSDPPLSPTVRWGLVGLGSLVAALAIGRAESCLSANDRSRWATVWSLVERGTYRIDEIDSRKVLHKPSGKRRLRFRTIDKVRHDGHFYSSKPPLLPTLVAGVYAGIRGATGWNLLDQTETVSRLILMLVNWLPWTIALVVLARMLDRYARHRSTRVLVLVTASVGTLLLPFLVALNNHTVAATAVVFVVAAVLRVTVDGDLCPRHFIFAGLFAGWAAANDLPAASLVAVAGWLLFGTDRRRTLMFFLPAVALVAVAFIGTNVIATGGWKPFYAYYGTEKYLWTVDGQQSYWLNPLGIDKGNDSPAVYLLHCLVGHHGIFSLSPVFLIGLLTISNRVRREGSPLVRLTAWTGLLTTVVLGFYLTRTQNYNYGGVSCALRWSLWLVPLWLMSLVPVVDSWSETGSRAAPPGEDPKSPASGRTALRVAWILTALSIVSAVFPLLHTWKKYPPPPNPFQAPWFYRLMEDWGWIAYG